MKYAAWITALLAAAVLLVIALDSGSRGGGLEAGDEGPAGGEAESASVVVEEPQQEEAGGEIEVHEVATPEVEEPVRVTGAPGEEGGLEVLVEGLVIFPEGFDAGEEAEFVRVWAERGGQRVGESSVDQDGWWSMEGLEWARGLGFVVEGGGLVEMRVESPEPDAEGVVRVELEPGLGHDMWFYAQDPQGGLVLDCSVRMEWLGEDRVMVRSPREDGYIRFRGCPEGSVVVTGTKEGYASAHMGPLVVPQLVPTTWALVFQQGRVLRGRCTYRGEPVEEFSLIWWPEPLAAQAQEKQFREAEGGRFELPDVALHAVRLTATAPGLGPAETVWVGNPYGGEEIELELQDPIPVVGTVLEASSREALVGSTVQLVPLSEDGHAGASLVEPVEVSAQGRFETVGTDSPSMGLLVRGPKGYRDRVVPLRSSGVSVLDVGEVLLSRASRLVFELAPSALEPGTVSVQGQPGFHVPEAVFDAAGVVVYPEVREEFVCLEFGVPGTTGWDICVPLANEREFRLTLPVGDCELRARYEDPEGEAVGARLFATHPSKFRARGPFEGREARLQHLAPATYQVQLLDPLGVVLASREVAVSGPMTEVDLTSTEAYRLRVVDGDGRPVVGADLCLRAAEGVEALVWGTTDDEGSFDYRAEEGLALAGYLVHPELGLYSGLELGAPEDGVVTLRFEPGALLQVDVVDGEGRPAADARVTLRETELTNSLGAPGRTDAGGQVSWPVTADSLFRMTVEKAGHWTHLQRGVEPGFHSVVLWSTTDLELELVDAGGLALVDVGFELSFEGNGEEVRAWIPRRQLGTSSAELRTGKGGRWRVEGVPVGRYWMRVEGVAEPLEVEAGPEGVRVRVVLPG